MPHCWYRGPRTICRSQRSPSTVWFPENEPPSSSLLESTFTNSPAQPSSSEDINGGSEKMAKYLLCKRKDPSSVPSTSKSWVQHVSIISRAGKAETNSPWDCLDSQAKPDWGALAPTKRPSLRNTKKVASEADLCSTHTCPHTNTNMHTSLWTSARIY